MSDTGPNEENRKRWRRIKMAWRAWRLYDKGSGWLHHAGGLGAVKANVVMAAAVAATATAGTYGAIAIRDTYIAPKQPVETAAIAPAPAEVRQTKNSVVFAIEGKDRAGAAPSTWSCSTRTSYGCAAARTSSRRTARRSPRPM